MGVGWFSWSEVWHFEFDSNTEAQLSNSGLCGSFSHKIVVEIFLTSLALGKIRGRTDKNNRKKNESEGKSDFFLSFFFLGWVGGWVVEERHV